MDETLAILDDIVIHNNGAVLTTIVHVEGSSYRKEGTMMLFTKDKQQIGMLSVGCLEEDAAIQAERLWNGNRFSQLNVYDMSNENDLGWGKGAGCQGKVHVLFEKITSQNKKELNQVRSLLQQGISVKAIKSLQEIPKPIETIYFPEKGDVFGTLLKNNPGKEYTHYFKPKRRMIIYGAGTDVPPLANMAVQTGFDVFVWDWRHALLQPDYLPNVSFITDRQSFTHLPGDVVIVMTHVFEVDQDILRHILHDSGLLYLGILGPRKRTKRLLQTTVIPHHIHSPVGLSIGAEGATEIAISIMAEVIARYRGVDLHQKIIGLYLAAGKSERFGKQNKLTATIRGHALGSIALQTALKSKLSQIVMVVDSKQPFNWFPKEKRVQVLNVSENTGQASSLKTGLTYAVANGATAILVLLADQPCITVRSINQLIQLYQKNPHTSFIAFTSVATIGPPIVINERLFPDIRRLKGDVGAKQLIQREWKNGITIEAVDESLFFDVDTLDDYVQLCQMLQK